MRGELTANTGVGVRCRWRSIQGPLRRRELDRWDVPPRLVHVPSGNLLRVVDLAARTTTTVFEAPAPITSVGVPYISSWGGTNSKQEQPILVRAGDKVYKLDHKYEPSASSRCRRRSARRVAISWYEVDDGRAVVACSLPTSDEDEDEESSATTSARRWFIGSRRTGRSRVRSNSRCKPGSAQIERTGGIQPDGLRLPAPAPLLGFESFLTAVQYRSSGYPRTLSDRVAARLAVAGGDRLRSRLALAVAAWRRGRGFGLSRRERNVWAVFVLLFGVPASSAFCSIVIGRPGSRARTAMRASRAIATPAPRAGRRSRPRRSRGPRSSREAVAVSLLPPGEGARRGG